MVKKLISFIFSIFLISCSIFGNDEYAKWRNNNLENYKRTVTTVLTNTNKISLYSGHKDKLTATVMHLDMTQNSAVDWSSSDNKIAVIDNDGNISAVKEGETTILAVSKEDKSIQAKVFVFVKSQEYGEAIVNIDIKESTIKLGKKLKLTATVLLSNGNILPNVIWKSEDDSIAEVSKDGIVFAKKIGETKIFAIAEGNQSKNAYTKIYVK